LCDPTMMAMMAGGSGLVDFIGTNRMANYQGRVAEVNNQIAAQDAMAQYEATVRREDQENLSAAQALEETRRASAQAQGTLRAAAGGTAGTDVGVLMDDFVAQEAKHRVATKRNLDFRREEFTAQREGIRLGLQSRQIANTPPPMPDFFGAALRIGVGAADSYYRAGGE